jgi:hypothetical protein
MNSNRSAAYSQHYQVCYIHFHGIWGESPSIGSRCPAVDWLYGSTPARRTTWTCTGTLLNIKSSTSAVVHFMSKLEPIGGTPLLTGFTGTQEVFRPPLLYAGLQLPLEIRHLS